LAGPYANNVHLTAEITAPVRPGSAAKKPLKYTDNYESINQFLI